MYKNPELSAQSKNLRTALKEAGFEVSHAQALELMARAQGNRTLHVAQAKKARQGLNVADLALSQASSLMFDTLGRYEGNIRGLLESIRAGFALEETEGSRAVEAAMSDIFEQEDSPRVSELFDRLRLDELPSEFDQLVQRLQSVLVAASGAPVPAPNAEHLLYEGPMLDWRVQEGFDLAELPAHQRTRYDVRVNRSGHQLYVDIAVPHQTPEDLDGTDQLSLFIEVNEGRPCVHLTNSRYGDQVLTVFAVRDGLYLRPDASDLAIRTGACREGSALAAVQQEEAKILSTMNHAFIDTSS